MQLQGKSVLLLLLLVLVAPLVGKRRPPAAVPPVIHAGLRYEVVPLYRALGNSGGYVRIVDIKRNRVVGGRFIYYTRYKQGLERYIQDIHITGLRLDASRRQLLITSSRGDRYRMELQTGRVFHCPGL